MKMLANGYNLEKNTSIYTYDFQIGDIFELQNQITKKNEKGLSHLARQTNEKISNMTIMNNSTKIFTSNWRKDLKVKRRGRDRI